MKRALLALLLLAQTAAAQERYIIYAHGRAVEDGGRRPQTRFGTDAPTAWIVPGASLHEEMKLLHDAGIANSGRWPRSTRHARWIARTSSARFAKAYARTS